MVKLVIVESPAKARTIGRYLGKGYRVVASMGHVRDLPPSKMGIDVARGFEPEYRIIKGKEKVIADLKKAARTADEVYLATDLDREGEAIAWHLAQAMNLSLEKTRRVVFNEITASAVRQAFSHPATVDENKVNAQQARRILDRIVGYELSPLLWRKVSRGLSAGRVQSVATLLVVNREDEIEAFKAEEYWEMEAELKPLAGAPQADMSFLAKLETLADNKAELHNEPECQSLAQELTGARYVVAEVVTKVKRGTPPPPFITSRLQQSAASRLRFSTRETMRIAQQLYEGVELGAEGSTGLITYMRTDSVRVAGHAVSECLKFIEQSFGSKYLPEKPRVFRQTSRAQAAHEAIRPSSVARRPEDVKPYLTDRQYRLYDLIWRRFVASQMAGSARKVTQVKVAAGRAIFGAEGSQLVFDGFERVSGKSEEEKLLPQLAPGQDVQLVQLHPSQHFTQAPPRYTEGSLVRTLERLGIGRPSTYAPIISTIQERGYVSQMQRKLYATPLGRVVTGELRKHFPALLNVKFTSHMEDELDKVEAGREQWRDLLKNFYQPFKKELEKAMSDMERVPGRKTDQVCEKCGKQLIIRSGSYGLFLGCSGYPECKFTKPLGGGSEEEQAAAQETNELCPQCGKPMKVRRGPRGAFLGCSGYPECKFTKQIAGAQRQPPKESGVMCDQCGKPMLIRHGKRGGFLGCSGFPKCRNTKPIPDKESGPKEQDPNG